MPSSQHVQRNILKPDVRFFQITYYCVGKLSFQITTKVHRRVSSKVILYHLHVVKWITWVFIDYEMTFLRSYVLTNV